MEMQGQRQLKVTQQQAWDALNDPSVLKACIAGCDKLDPTAQNQFDVGIALKIGPVSAKFTGNIKMTDVVAPNSYQLNFDGSGGAAGFGKGTSKVVLEPNDEGTLLHYTVAAQVGGKIAQMGQRLIDGVAKSMAEDFFGKFEAQLTEKYASDAAVSNNAVKSATGLQTQAAAGGLPTWVWFVGAAVIVVVAVLVLR
jgi:uncharacterized protein